MRSTVGCVLLCATVLFLVDLSRVVAKPAAAGPCIDCLMDGNPHEHSASPDNDVIGDAGVAKTADVEELMHAGDQVHDVAHHDVINGGQAEEGDTERPVSQDLNSETVDLAQRESYVEGAPAASEGAIQSEVNSMDSRNVESVAQELEREQGGAEDADDPGRTFNHPKGVRNVNGEGAGQYGAGNVEEIVHGEDGVHDPSSQHDAPEPDDNGHQFQPGDLEELMHGVAGVHDDSNDDPDVPELKIAQEFKSGDVEEMVHGERHVHDNVARGDISGPFRSGDVEELVHGADSQNVHDPTSRHKVNKEVASAGDVDRLMRGDADDDNDAQEDRGKIPTVMDGEHMLHGAGGHEHDVKQLKFVKTKEENNAKDRFSDVHAIIMHSDDEDDDHSDDKIRRGKKVTYKDIMALGLDEDMLKGIDLNQLLLQDAEEYDDWQRERLAFKGEVPEGSFWEQVGELRKRYLSFGRNDGKARDLTGAKLDPEKQEWVTGRDLNKGADVKDGDEDDVLHELELLGNTAAVGDRHKHGNSKDVTDNERDVTDL